MVLPTDISSLGQGGHVSPTAKWPDQTILTVKAWFHVTTPTGAFIVGHHGHLHRPKRVAMVCYTGCVVAQHAGDPTGNVQYALKR